MTTQCQTFDVERLASLETREALIREIQHGLLLPPRSLAPWMFYDANGSRLFERITQLPEYYVTRIEENILASSAREIIAAARGGRSEPMRILELGAGTASKTALLLRAAVSPEGDVVYRPVDVSSDALDIACERVASSAPEVCIEPIVANYMTDPPQLDTFSGTTLALYIGSSIGNFSPEEARAILRNLRSQLQGGDALLLGTDMVKDESTLVAAYDDREGVTAEFNINILRRLNRELGADFDPASFRHRAWWNRVESRIEMHLESAREQRVRIAAANLDLRFAKWETIHTENSYKFTPQTLRGLLEDAGFALEQTWTDERGWYAVTLGRMR